MLNNTFWKYLGDFWNEFETKSDIESVWGSWDALMADANLQLEQINDSKSIYSIPLYWKKLWVPIETKEIKTEYDLIPIEKEKFSPSVKLSKVAWASLGSSGILIDSVSILEENGSIIGLENFEINYYEGLIKIKDSSELPEGHRINASFKIGIVSNSLNITLEHKNLKYRSESIFSVSLNRFLNRRIDYNINYSDGTITFAESYMNIINYNYLSLDVTYPFKYKLPSKMVYASSVYKTPSKMGLELKLNIDFTIEGEYIRFKEKPYNERYWAEEALFTTDNIYRVFGSRVGFLDENSLDYYTTVLGMILFLQSAPTPQNIAGACSAIFNIPFSFFNDEVIDSYKDENGDHILLTKVMKYNLKDKLPSVYIGQELSALQPLTDDVKVYDAVNTKNFVELLLTKEIVKSDLGFKSDDGLLSDSMWSESGRRRLFAPAHTFIVEVSDSSFFYNNDLLRQVRFMLSNRSARTIYLFLFKIYLESRREVQDDYLTIDLNFLNKECYFGEKISESEIPATPSGEVLIELAPRTTQMCCATIEQNPILTNVNPEPKRFSGTWILEDGKLITPFSYTNFRFFYPDKTEINLSDEIIIFDENKLTLSSETYNGYIYISATRNDGLLKKDRILISKEPNRFFDVTILFETFHMLGTNTNESLIKWTVNAFSEFSEGAYSEGNYLKNLSYAFSDSRDFNIDEEAKTVSIPETSVLFNGQLVYIDFYYLNFEAAEVDPRIEVDMDEECDNSTEILTMTDIDSILSPKEAYLDGTLACDALNAEEALDNITGEVNTRVVSNEMENGYPKCFKVMPQPKNHTLQIEWLPDNTSHNYELDSDFLDNTQIISLTSSDYIGNNGRSPYIYRYKLPVGGLFINRLSSIEDGGFKYREKEYLIDRDFIIHSAIIEGEDREIRSKTQLEYLDYYAFRFNPIDSPITDLNVVIGPSNYIGNSGNSIFPHAYPLGRTFDNIIYILSNDQTNYEWGELKLEVNKDFIILGDSILLKNQLIDDIEFAIYYYRFSIIKHKYQDNIIINNSNFISEAQNSEYPFIFELSIPAMEIYSIVNKKSTNYKYGKFAYFTKEDFKLNYNSSLNRYEIHFKKMPGYTEYELYYVILHDKIENVNVDSRDSLKFFSSWNKVQAISWKGKNINEGTINETNVDGIELFFTEEIDPKDERVLISESYVYRTSGPSVPRYFTVTEN